MISNYYQEEGVQIHLSSELGYVLKQILGYTICENVPLQQEISDLQEFLHETIGIYRPDLFDERQPSHVFINNSEYVMRIPNIDILERRV